MVMAEVFVTVFRTPIELFALFIEKGPFITWFALEMMLPGEFALVFSWVDEEKEAVEKVTKVLAILALVALAIVLTPRV